jgi:pimeloyl-ACP methyl ester carboxylesterase
VHVEIAGSGPRIVLVHGSVGNGQESWAEQRLLAERFTLVIVDRPGFLPNPPVDRVDFEEHAGLVAELLEDGDHLVGHSYGGVVSLYAAAARSESLRSLTVIEPPAFGLARGRKDVDDLIARLIDFWEAGPRDPREFLARFLAEVGRRGQLPDPLPPGLEQGARTLMVERGPWEADPPLDKLADAPFPKLVVSGAHHFAFDAVCDVLEERLGAERAVLPGAGHQAQRAPGFNETLVDFLARAERASLSK